MLTKIVPVARTVGAASRLQLARCMGGHAPAHWKSDKQIALENQSHMNSLPVPEGSWQENYNRRNARWNTQLALSAVFFVATMIVADQYECFYLHGAPEMKNK